MAWRLRIWCNDCSGGQDPQGCFEGGESTSDEVFATRVEAEWFGMNTVTGPWDCEPEETDTPVNAVEAVPDVVCEMWGRQ